jgi:signal transduction histidine kinase/CheY-like chemotaxis protein
MRRATLLLSIILTFYCFNYAFSSKCEVYSDDLQNTVPQTVTGNSPHNIDSLMMLISEVENTDNDSIKAILYYQIGLFFINVNLFDRAIEYLNKSDIYYGKENDSESQALVKHTIGNIFKKQGKYVLARDYQNSALLICQQTGNKNLMAKILKEIGNIYIFCDEFDSALILFRKSLQLFEELNDTVNISYIYNNIGVAYKFKGNINEALKFYKQSLALKKNIPPDNRSISATKRNIGLLYSTLCDFKSAKLYLSEALAMKIMINDSISIAEMMNELGFVLVKLKEYPLAIQYLTKARKLSHILHIGENEQNSLKNIAIYYRELGNNKQSLEYFRLYAALKDSLFTLQNLSKIEEYKQKYETEKKEKEFEEKKKERSSLELKEEKNFRNLTIFLLILILLVFVILFRQYKIKLKINKLLLEKNLSLEQSNKELIKVKEKAMESDKIKSSFLANMSHEIRTPMNAIIGFSSLLTKNNLTLKEQTEFVEEINTSSNELLKLIEDIIDTAKIHAGEIDITFSHFDINGELRDLYQLVKKEKQKNSVNLILHIPENQQQNIILTDGKKVRQILLSLIRNAIKFTEKGDVEFGYEVKESNVESNISVKLVEFYIKDTGIGIEKSKLEIIFETFRKGIDTDTRLYSGTGLGLSISKSLVEILGGRIWLNTAIGKGSTFNFTIPYNPAEIETHPIFTGQLLLKKNFEGKSFLIVEDEKTNYFLLKALINSYLDINIVWAQNGQEAVEFCQNRTDIILILMDIKLPVMNGYEATKWIKSIKPEIPIIAETAYVLPHEREKIILSGCDDYISKPIHAEELFNKLEKWLK